MIPEYTLVIGVDSKHLDKLGLVWPTWKRHKPSLLNVPMVVFTDRASNVPLITGIVDHPRLAMYLWPPNPGTVYSGDGTSKWENSQRHKMLTGFVYIPTVVETPYWLKLDLDVIADGRDDWIDPLWFEGNPAIISHPWRYTKPPDQMLQLDQWVDRNSHLLPELVGCLPLNLHPKPDSIMVSHKRIISWCAFFNTNFTRQCATKAAATCEPYHIPVPSQDGYMWYVAKRSGAGIVRADMKRWGWRHWTTMFNIQRSAEEVMSDGFQAAAT